MDNQTILNYIKILPNNEELSKITENEPEAIYIFRNVLSCLDKFSIDYSNELLQAINESLEESYYLIESLIEKMWEKINTGHFSEVPLNIRKIYAAANYFKIILNFITNNEDLQKSYECLDKAILIGCTENLYSRNLDFLNGINDFLNTALDLSSDSILPFIEPLKFEEFDCDISILDCPSVELFHSNFFQIKQPVLLRNTIKHWPALDKWRNPNYLLQVAGNRSVPIEIGSNYTNENWSQELIKIKDFLKRNFSQNHQLQDDSNRKIEYLAQHELFDQIPKLKEDIRIPDYCCSDLVEINKTNVNYQLLDKDLIDIKAWLGPCGTISPMHQDPKNNILCQVFGRKQIILAAPENTENLYPHQTGFLNNTSSIDAENIDFFKYPLAKNVKFLKLILQEGECLYLPPKWWHFVKSLNKSFSVSFWWE